MPTGKARKLSNTHNATILSLINIPASSQPNETLPRTRPLKASTPPRSSPASLCAADRRQGLMYGQIMPQRTLAAFANVLVAV